jgi:transposase-like protein
VAVRPRGGQELPAFLREIVEKKLQELLEAEMTEHVGAIPYELTTERKGHRNRHKMRTLVHDQATSRGMDR